MPLLGVGVGVIAEMLHCLVETPGVGPADRFHDQTEKRFALCCQVDANRVHALPEVVIAPLESALEIGIAADLETFVMDITAGRKFMSVGPHEFGD